MLEFVGDAICLSGLAGTKLKCDVLGSYYPFWWGITSGGQAANYEWPTAIVELHAGTGEVYIKDTDETLLGSSGHALELKSSKAPLTDKLKVVLVEENRDCCVHMKSVIKRRWPNIPVDKIEGPWAGDVSRNVYLLNRTLDGALPVVSGIHGNAIYFFDPLRNVEWNAVEKVAANRLTSFYQTGTEFILFSFTSDWFLGRADFSPLPSHNDEGKWSKGERNAVEDADSLFGSKGWRKEVLCEKPISWKERKFIDIYKIRLRKWFRYILPLPFNPKGEQIFHLIFCSNYEAGVRMNRQFYASITGNNIYSPNWKPTFQLFKRLHPQLFVGMAGNRRPLQWKMLWKIIVNHEDGVSDMGCRDFSDLDKHSNSIQDSLEWLHKNDYLSIYPTSQHWRSGQARQYVLNWRTVQERLDVTQPCELEPVSQEQLVKNMGK